MLAEYEVGRGRQNVFLRDNRVRRRAKPPLNLGAFVGREDVKTQIVSPRRGAPMIPSPPLRFGIDVELLVVTQVLARLVDEAVAHAACIVGLACQDVSER